MVNLKNNIKAPRLGDMVHVHYLSEYLIPHTFIGYCTDVKWAHGSSSIEVFNPSGFTQRFFLFSPLVLFWETFYKNRE